MLYLGITSISLSKEDRRICGAEEPPEEEGQPPPPPSLMAEASSPREGEGKDRHCLAEREGPQNGTSTATKERPMNGLFPFLRIEHGNGVYRNCECSRRGLEL